MKVVIQRVLESSVEVDNVIVGKINRGYNLLIGVEKGDTQIDVEYVVNKISYLRIFNDENGKMNLSIKDIGGEILAISQFTLLADTKHGRRPSFINSELPEIAKDLYIKCCEEFEKEGIHVEKGIFQSEMKVNIINDGPVTIVIDSRVKNDI